MVKWGMAEKGPNGQKLIAGSYEAGKKGGSGYRYWVREQGSGGIYKRERFFWVKAPRGYSLDGHGGLVKEGTMPQVGRRFDSIVTMADMYSKARDESEERNDRGPSGFDNQD